MKPVLNIALHFCRSFSLSWKCSWNRWRVFSTTESSSVHGWEEDSNDGLLSPAFVCLCAYVLVGWVTVYLSVYKMFVKISVHVRICVCARCWQHTRCPLSRDSTINIGKQQTCWKALTLSTPLHSVHPSFYLSVHTIASHPSPLCRATLIFICSHSSKVRQIRHAEERESVHVLWFTSRD